MIIDIHGHTNAPAGLNAYVTRVLVEGGLRGKGAPVYDAEEFARIVNRHIKNNLDAVGTDVQFISPRPVYLLHSDKPEHIVHWCAEAHNNAIATTLEIAPGRYRGVGTIPICPGRPITEAFDELDRCVNDLGFVGIMINPDPHDGSGEHFPGMGDEYWYPLYEKMVQMDVPGLIHSNRCKDPWDDYTNYFITTETRCIFSMVTSQVFKAFPQLKIIVSHGGGAVPYQRGRYRSYFNRHLGEEFVNGGGFDAELKKFYFDTVLYDRESLQLLLGAVGSDRCMFGTENPGAGSYRDPRTGKMQDDIKPVIESIPGITEQQKLDVFENVARRVFTRLQA
jgi:4-oxalmesaconate hydratase